MNKTDVLWQILRSIQRQYNSGDHQLRHQDLLNAIQIRHVDGIENGIDPELATFYTNDENHGRVPVLFVTNNPLRSSREIRRRLRATGLKDIFAKSKIISFDDWAGFNEASELWDILRTDVIKPLQRRDFEFIFYLGRVAHRRSFEVDEILDIISDFSFNGNVTLVLNHRETSELQKLITGDQGSGRFRLPEAGELIFKAMRIRRLLVYSPDHHITMYSKEGRQEWAGRKISSPNLDGSGKDFFTIGYVLGLLLELEPLHCSALGLTLSGAYLRHEEIRDLQALLAYIRNWINELDETLLEHNKQITI
jgi:hypothetical protein